MRGRGVGCIRLWVVCGTLMLAAAHAQAWHIDSEGHRGAVSLATLQAADEAGPPTVFGLPQHPGASFPDVAPAPPISAIPPEALYVSSAEKEARPASNAALPAAKQHTRVHFGRLRPERLAVHALATGVLIAYDGPIIESMRAHVPESARHSWPVEAVSDLGGALPPLCAAAMIALGDDEVKDTGKMALTAVAVNGLIVNGMKGLTGRQRPKGLDEPGGFYGPGRGYNSFPSGHASSAFAFATVVGKRHRGLKWWLYGAATLVAGSRVLLDVHHPSDVLAGALIGIEVGNLVLRNDAAIARISIKF